MNQLWHETHHLNHNGLPLEQLSWHMAHQKNCGCTPIPPRIQRIMPSGRSAS